MNDSPLFCHTVCSIACPQEEYLSKPWKNPEELYWIGKYASDAYKVFIKRTWHDVQPNDHALNWWVEWKRGTQQMEGGVHPTVEPAVGQLQDAGANGLKLAESAVACRNAVNVER
ncbi:unnamed protein product [Pylaiella littoralis]